MKVIAQTIEVSTKLLKVFMTSLTNRRNQTCQKMAVVWLNMVKC